MYYSDWEVKDGYEESIASFEEGSPPVLRVRVVLDSHGLYNPVVRDYQNGHILAELKTISNVSLKDVKETTIKLAVSYLTKIAKIRRGRINI
jgi:hypothetical protein